MTKFYDAVESNPFVIIVRCPDRRFRWAHRRFIEEELGLNPEDFWPLKPAGGAAALAMPTQMSDTFTSLIAEIELFVKHSIIRHMVLMTHEDCRRMDGLIDRSQSGPHPERQCLTAGIRLLERKFPKIEISAYYARFNEDRTKIYFEAVKASSLQKPDLELAEAEA